MEMHAFHSKTKSETPRKFKLVTPEGVETEEYLLVVGFHSTAFVDARAEFREKVVENAAAKVPEKGYSEKHKSELLAKAVVDWSFTEAPATYENVEAFLRECPHIAEDLDTFLYDRKSFFSGAV